MTIHRRFVATDLHHTIGRETDNGCWASTGDDGCLSFGPYLGLEPDSYLAAFYLMRNGAPSGAAIELDVFSGAHGQFAQRRFEDRELCGDIAGMIALPFTIDAFIPDIETRVHVEGGARIALREIAIFSARTGLRGI